MSFLKPFRGKKIAIWGLSRQSACQRNITLGHNVTSVRLDFIYTCSSMWSTAVWLQSSHRKHPLMSGVKTGPGVEHYYLHTHTHTRTKQPGHLTVESRANALLLCPSKQQTRTHTCSTFTLIYLCLQRPHQQGGRERKKERKGWKRGTPKCRLSVLLELLKALGSPSRMKLPALIWLYLLCYFNNKENILCFIYIHSVEKWQCFTFSNSSFPHLNQTLLKMLACKC